MFTLERNLLGAKALNDGNCFDLQQFVETRLKTKYNLSSTTIFFEVINLNEDFSIDLEENDIKKIFSQFGQIKHVEIKGNQVSISFIHYFSLIFSLETICELIDKEKKVFLKPRLLNEEENSSHEMFARAMNNNSFYYTNPAFHGFYYNSSPFNNYHSKYQLFDTPVYQNEYKYEDPKASIQKELNYKPNSNIFVKKSSENDLKFQTDNNSFKSSTPNNYPRQSNVLLLNTNSPIFFPNSFGSSFGNNNFSDVNSFGPTYNDFTFSDDNKFISIYDIQIENDDKFKVTKRVIGIKGNNMKKILNTCKLRFAKINSNDLIKIRLRGKGSGYKEGVSNKESDESLQLCVSSKYYDVYVFTCSCIECLLKKIYSDYHEYLQMNKFESKGPKEIKKLDYKIAKNH